MNDYSEYLNTFTPTGQPMLEFIEEQWQKNKHIHERQAEIVDKWAKEFKIGAVSEFGCATGNTASLLKGNYKYYGMDGNGKTLTIAQRKMPDAEFTLTDIRNFQFIKYNKDKRSHLVFAFAFMKHFSLEEWSDILEKLSFGDFLIFDIPIAEMSKDDGTEFHHVWRTIDEVKQEIKNIGFELVEIEDADSIEPTFICKRKNLKK